jgi:choice-of-anchor B domain-containing protein
MKKIYSLIFFWMLASAAFAQLNITLASQFDYDEECSNIWGYVAPDGIEYALVGTAEGVSIVNLADPYNPIESDFIPGAPGIWRELKTWGHFCYVSNETANGIQIIDLSNLPGEVTFENWTPNIPGLGTLNTCHSLAIDEFGWLYLNGTNLNGGGILYIDVFSTPGVPIYVGKGPAVYCHDMYARNNLIYAGEIYDGYLTIYDATDKLNPILLGSVQTPGAFTHNTGLSDNSEICFTTDETENAPVTSYDVTDPTDIIELDQYRPFETLGEGVIPHNVHPWLDWLIVSYYTDGCKVVDAARPDNLIEVGNFDTFLGGGGGFDGAWGVYPYLPSGLILVSDISSGLYVLIPNYVRACYLEGVVTDAVTGANINAASVDILGDLAIENTKPNGEYKTGLAIPGTYTVEAKKPGYLPATATVELVNGELTLLDFQLQPLASITLNGIVKDLNTGTAIPDAKVQVVNDDFTFNATTNSNGEFAIPGIFEGVYDVLAGKWGYKTGFLSSESFNENNNTIEVEIETGIEDVFSLDLGWTLSGDAPQGNFELGNPIAVSVAQLGGIDIQPENDSDNDPGNSCYITGNVADLFTGVQGTGTTTITSPLFDLTGMNEPHISFSTWLYTIQTNGAGVGNDKLFVKLTNGTETINLLQTSNTDVFAQPVWTNHDLNVTTSISATANMQVIVEIGDNDPNFSDVAEAGFDFFTAYDASPTSTNEVLGNGISMSVLPNPSSSDFTINYELDSRVEDYSLAIFNSLGQLVETMPLDAAANEVRFGEDLQHGIFFVIIRGQNADSPAIRLVKQ